MLKVPLKFQDSHFSWGPVPFSHQIDRTKYLLGIEVHLHTGPSLLSSPISIPLPKTLIVPGLVDVVHLICGCPRTASLTPPGVGDRRPLEGCTPVATHTLVAIFYSQGVLPGDVHFFQDHYHPPILHPITPKIERALN